MEFNRNDVIALAVAFAPFIIMALLYALELMVDEHGKK